MPTPRQLSKRRNHIGASDVGAIIGVDPFRSAADVWVAKVYGDTFEGNEMTALGQALEPALLTWAQERLGKLRRNVERRVKDWDAPVIVHTDAELIESHCPVEAKASGLGWAGGGEEWGDSGTGEVPERVEAQVLTQMTACRVQMGHVAAWLGKGRGRVLFEVQWNEEVVDYIRIEVERFWRDYVQTRTPPPDSVPALSVLRGIDRIESEIDLPDGCGELVEEYQRASEGRLKLEKVEKSVQAEILHLLGNADAGRMGDGRLITFKPIHVKEQVRKAYTYRRMYVKDEPKALPAPEEDTDGTQEENQEGQKD